MTRTHRHRTHAYIALGAALALSAVGSLVVQAGERIAAIERLQGPAAIDRAGTIVAAQVGGTLERHDRLTTGPDARLLVTFEDGSKLTVGENADVVIDDFMAEQGRRSGALILDLIKGAIRLASAKPVNAPDKRVEVKTATANLMAKLTEFWTGPVDGRNGVLLYDGALAVRNDAGSVALDKKRLGTTVVTRSDAPEKPAAWPPDMMSRAAMTVAFK